MVAAGIDVGKAKLSVPILDRGPECRYATAKPGPRALHNGLVRHGVGRAVSAATRSDHWQLHKRLAAYRPRTTSAVRTSTPIQAVTSPVRRELGCQACC